MVKLIRAPLSSTSTHSSVGTKHRSQKLLGGTRTRWQLGQRAPMMRLFSFNSRKKRVAALAAGRLGPPNEAGGADRIGAQHPTRGAYRELPVHGGYSLSHHLGTLSRLAEAQGLILQDLFDGGGGVQAGHA